MYMCIAEHGFISCADNAISCHIHICDVSGHGASIHFISFPPASGGRSSSHPVI